MEDTARLALVEQVVNNVNTYNQILQELLQFINHILADPHDTQLRVITNYVLKRVMKYEAFSDYLKYVGFIKEKDSYTFPREQPISKLRVAQAALERKISFCSGFFRFTKIKHPINTGRRQRTKYLPVKVLTTRNELLVRIQALFNDMIKYEDRDLQEAAREQIPLITLQLMAIDRMREQQRKIKSGEIEGEDMSYDIALLLELLSWFKNKFFTWVDKPPCDRCGEIPTFVEVIFTGNETERYRVELYKCEKCKLSVHFPRFNDPRTLLRTRRGRCGEWANCFALLCRALGYDTRYIFDTTDHVWCEIYDYESNRWLHVDPCEGVMDTPLMYTHGWGKNLLYVIALSKDDIQDVTWRYTTNHKEVLRRRRMNDVSEAELLHSILTLRAARLQQVTPARKKYLVTRTLRELVDLLQERKPSDYESQGRISGSREWRAARGEVGTDTGHVFEFKDPGQHSVFYSVGLDRYRVTSNGEDLEPLKMWLSGVFKCRNMFRKVEHDWKKVYLARELGEELGIVSWKIAAKGDGVEFEYLSVRAVTEVYENGSIEWTLQFDENEPEVMELAERKVEYKRRFRSVTVQAKLSGGLGDVAWQHAQLFRQPLELNSNTFQVQVRLVQVEPEGEPEAQSEAT